MSRIRSSARRRCDHNFVLDDAVLGAGTAVRVIDPVTGRTWTCGPPSRRAVLLR